ncbi:YebF family protein [Sodalis sp. RH21]|uniref:YebF family protein n=1 Tax=unclassified Sodalis (in: enterobacteria) TaxID=2636512 RepID=UPI0039B62E52
MQKMGIGLLGVMAVGMMLSSLAGAADQAPPVEPQTSTAQPPADAESGAQQPAGQTDAKPPANAVPAPAPTPPADNAAPDSSAPADKPAPVNADKKPAAEKKNAVGQSVTGNAAEANKVSAANKAQSKKGQPPRTFKVSPCPDLNAPQVAELIKQDYTQNRFPRADDDKKALGETIVTQVNPEDITGSGDNWQAPLKIRGQSADRAFAVTLDCQAGEISYALQP